MASFSGSSDYETDTSVDEPVKDLYLTQFNKLDEEPSKKKLFLSDIDSTEILNSMFEYQSEHNVNPTAYIESFLEFIKNSLNVDDAVTKNQLKDKIRRIKSNYESKKGKGLNNMKPNERAVFELADKVWGEEEDKTVKKVKKESSKKRKADENGNGSKADENESVVKADEKVETVVPLSVPRNENGSVVRKNASRKCDDAFENEAKRNVGNGDDLFGWSRMVDKFMKIGAELFGGDEEVEGSDEWRELEREEMEIYVKQLDVKSKKFKLVLDALEE